MKEEWLFPYAIVPVDVETTAALVAEIHRLIGVVGGMALAQPEQEPVGEIVDAIEGAFKCSFTKMLPVGTKLYTTPPQRTWVGLTDKDWNRSKHNYDFQKGVDWAESILKEKNT